MKTIDVVLPVYNEAQGLPHFHRELERVIATLSQTYRFHVIYVLDPSRDESFGVLKEIAATRNNVTVVHLARRVGHQMSLVAGIDRSTGDALIMMDCDLQHPPSVIPQLLEKFEEGNDVVQTIRTYDRAISAGKRLSSSLFYAIQNSMSPVRIEDGAADFRLISQKVVRVFQTSIREQNQFLRGLFAWVGFRCARVAFVSPQRFAGDTKYHFWRLLAFSVLGITTFSKVPLRFATFMGLLMAALSVGHGVWLLCYYLLGGEVPAGYTSILLMLAFIGGLQLMVLGILGEYIGSIFDEVKARPLYVVDEIVSGVKA
jgi:glycosyltransferase involved in cell wall biosynthesis